ncbi:MAG: DUF86 domain-containing protein [Deltaproteobacteria bacterium]|nr:DUF86 domain-containing protein [Deltaproteobacteria bacterium]
MIETDVIESKLRFLKEYLVDLEEFETISLEDYRTNKKDQRFVERTLQLACECCLDIAAHLVSRLGYREPRDNKDLFAVLSENQVITGPVHESMVKMAKFRNIVVHDYTRIDPEIVVGILRDHLADFRRFAKEIIDFSEDWQRV